MAEGAEEEEEAEAVVVADVTGVPAMVPLLCS